MKPPAISTLDVANHEIFAALGEAGCPLCRTEAVSERRAVRALLREERRTSAVRETFVDSGGFCRRHAWLLHDEARREGTGAGIADVYGLLAERDFARISEMLPRLSGSRARRTIRRYFEGRTRCYVCAQKAQARERHAFFLCQLLAAAEAREAYTRSDGLCFTHLACAVDRCLDRRRTGGDLAIFLLDEWRHRLGETGVLLGDYDRKRDFRHADEGPGAEQHSWTEIIRRYVGDDEPRRDSRASGRRRPAASG
jgi:hypothetical protein